MQWCPCQDTAQVRAVGSSEISSSLAIAAAVPAAFLLLHYLTTAFAAADMLLQLVQLARGSIASYAQRYSRSKCCVSPFCGVCSPWVRDGWWVVCIAVSGIPLPDLVAMGQLAQKDVDDIVQRTRNGGGEIVE